MTSALVAFDVPLVLSQVVEIEFPPASEWYVADSLGFGNNHGNILYVSKLGNNSTAVKGDINKPWLDPWQAQEDASNGDLIFVFPGIYLASAAVKFSEAR